jgi:hypothetical protein
MIGVGGIRSSIVPVKGVMAMTAVAHDPEVAAWMGMDVEVEAAILAAAAQEDELALGA